MGSAPGDGGGSALAFQAKGLNKVYRTGETEVHALRDVDLEIAQGEVLVLLGPSGSGNSHCSTSLAVSIARPRGACATATMIW